MSTAIVTPIVRASVPAVRLRLTTRGRRVLAGLAAAPAILVLAFALFSGGAALASGDAAPGSTDSFSSIVVAPGDTLWSIAQEVAPAEDPRDVVDAIVRLNAVEGAVVMSGQRLAIPAEYDPAR